MNALTKTLLGSVAISALAVPAMAARPHPAFNLTALHASKMVNKTNMHNQKAGHVTYTLGLYSQASLDVVQKVPLAVTFFRWNSYSTLCSLPKQKAKFPSKKTEHGKLSHATQTYSEGCPSGPTVFNGAAYTLTSPGSEDHFVVVEAGKFRNSNGTYKATLNLDITLLLE